VRFVVLVHPHRHKHVRRPIHHPVPRSPHTCSGSVALLPVRLDNNSLPFETPWDSLSTTFILATLKGVTKARFVKPKGEEKMHAEGVGSQKIVLGKASKGERSSYLSFTGNHFASSVVPPLRYAQVFRGSYPARFRHDQYPSPPSLELGL
jgi:hypothetical protein